MKTFLRKNIRQFLAIMALVFLGIIAAYFFWGIATISLAINTVTDSATQTIGSTAFDLQDAKALNLKGLVQ